METEETWRCSFWIIFFKEESSEVFFLRQSFLGILTYVSYVTLLTLSYGCHQVLELHRDCLVPQGKHLVTQAMGRIQNIWPFISCYF